LFVADVRVDGSVTSRSSQVLTFAEGDVFAVGVLVALRQPEIDDVDVVLVGIVATDEEVVGLDVSVNDALLVDLLNALNLFPNIFTTSLFLTI
jgi:hypothetical protein